MKKVCIIFVVIVLFLSIFLAGCEEKATDVGNGFENILFESNVAKLAHGKVTFVKDNNVIIRTEVEFLLKNIVDRVVNLRIIAEFYDNDNNLLYISEPHTIENMPIDYQESEILASNIIKYSGDFASIVDYVKLIVTEQ